MSSDSHAPVHTHCQNCNTELTGPYCAKCGQKDFDFHRSFGHVVHEALETWFHVDGSFLRGFYHLLFRPGLMTQEFNAGQRARHVPPLRFYLVISLVFFFVMAPHELSDNEVMVIDGAGVESGLTPASESSGLDNVKVQVPFASPETNEALSVEARRKLAEPAELLLAFLHALPKTLLVCLPLFALLTRVVFLRSGWVYLQHLILSVHLHTFVFLWWMVAYGWAKLVGLWSEPLAGLFGVAAVLYALAAFYAALRTCFGGSRRRIFLKGTLVGTAYFLVLLLAMTATFAIALLF